MDGCLGVACDARTCAVSCAHAKSVRVQVETDENPPSGVYFRVVPGSAKMKAVQGGDGFVVMMDVEGLCNKGQTAHITLGFHDKEAVARAHVTCINEPNDVGGGPPQTEVS